MMTISLLLKRALPTCALLIVFLLHVRPAFADTAVTGAISTDATWNLAGSPYVLNDEVSVESGVTLTLEPGVEVRGTNASTVLRVQSGGSLVAESTETSPVVFESVTRAGTGRWYGIDVQAGGSIALNHVTILNARTAVTISDASDARHSLQNVTVGEFSTHALLLLGDGETLTVDSWNVTAPEGTQGVRADGTATLLNITGGRFIGGDAMFAVDNMRLSLSRLIATDAATVAEMNATIDGAHRIDVEHCTFANNANVIVVSRNADSDDRTLDFRIVRSVFTGNEVTITDTSTRTSYRATFEWFEHNVVDDVELGRNANGYLVAENHHYNPLLVDVEGGDFAPTERSPARFWSRTDGNGVSGAIPYAGDATPGAHGFWYEGAVFPSNSVTHVAGDLVIVAGTTLTLLPGARLEMATSDRMRAGLDDTRVELRVDGTLETDGTNSRPVVLTSSASSPARGDWYGVVVPQGAEGLGWAQVALSYAYRGVTLDDNERIIADSLFHDCDTGVYTYEGAPTLINLEVHDAEVGVHLAGGSPSLTGVVVHHATTGIELERGAVATIDQTDVHDCEIGLHTEQARIEWTVGRVFDNDVGLFVDADAGFSYQTPRLNLDHLTIAHNAQAVSVSAGRYANVWTLWLTNSNVTHNGAGIRANDLGGFSCAGTNIWGPERFAGDQFWTEPVCLDINPIYADADARDYALTTHSPGRFLGSGGTHSGAVPYAGAPGPQLMGYLWEDFTFTAEDSPYTILGDLYIPPGATVTFAPGAVLHVVESADQMVTGEDPTLTEIAIIGGTVVVDGSAAPAEIGVDTAEYTPGLWAGIRADDATTSIFDNLAVRHAAVGLEVVGPGAPRILRSTFQGNQIGVRATAVDSAENPLEIHACDFVGPNVGLGRYGIVADNVSARVTSSVFTHLNVSISTELSEPGHRSFEIVNNTFYDVSTGISVITEEVSHLRSLTIAADNNIFADGGVAYRDRSRYWEDRAAVTFRNNNFAEGTSDGVNSGDDLDSVTESPLYEDNDVLRSPRWWDARVWAESPVIDAGTGDAALPATDRAGNPRVLGAQVDIGAFEHDATANQQPRADAVAGHHVVAVGEVFELDGTPAYDPDGTLAAAYWTLPDEIVVPGVHARWVYAESGWRMMYLTVLDDEGEEDHAIVTFDVSDLPIADAGQEVYQDEGLEESVYFDAVQDEEDDQGSYDPDGSIVTFHWDFGDGTTADGAQVVHSYLHAGEYLVTLTVTDNDGLTASDTTVAHVFGDADTTGPLILHTPVAGAQPIGAPVLISAVVTDTTGVSSVVLGYRAVGDVAARFVAMTSAGGDLYEALIPGVDVGVDGVEYWIQAFDIDERDSLAPPGAPTSAVWAITVQGDMVPPTIVHTEITDGQPSGAAVRVAATIADPLGVARAQLTFRTQGGEAFAGVAMTNTGGNNWTADIPAFVITTPGVEYFITATDFAAVPNTGRAPASGVFDFSVSPSGDTNAPRISHSPVADGQSVGVALPISAEVTDESLQTVRLFYRVSGVGAFAAVSMDNTTGNFYSAMIPDAALTEAGVDYYLIATDAAGNSTHAPASAPTTPYTFTAGEADRAGPHIVHTKIASGRPVGADVTVRADVTDSSGVNRVEVRYRPQGLVGFTTVEMTSDGDTWTGTIPAFSVSSPALEYYLRAYDDLGNASLLPDDGLVAPFVFTVVEVVGTAPEITHTPETGVGAGEDLVVSATITDDMSVEVAELTWPGDGGQEVVVMSASGDVWTATIPWDSHVDGIENVTYTIRAEDADGNEAYSPEGGPVETWSVPVNYPDTTAPTITLQDPTGPFVAAVPITLGATVTDDVGVSEASLHYRVEGGDWMDTAMNATGALYTAVVPSEEVIEGDLHWYVSAADDAGNMGVAPADGSAGAEVIVVEAATTDDDVAPPAILHAAIEEAVAGESVAIDAVVTDASGIAEVGLAYRIAGTSDWTELGLVMAGDDAYAADIPSESVTATGLEYYLWATDSAPAANEATKPLDAPVDWFDVVVREVGEDAGGDTGEDVRSDAGDVVDTGDTSDAGDVSTDTNGATDATVDIPSGDVSVADISVADPHNVIPVDNGRGCSSASPRLTVSSTAAMFFFGLALLCISKRRRVVLNHR